MIAELAGWRTLRGRDRNQHPARRTSSTRPPRRLRPRPGRDRQRHTRTA
jgi:hypothetical protein